MNLMKKIALSWVLVSVTFGAWILITVEPYKATSIDSAVIDKCKEVVEDNEDKLIVKLNGMGFRTGQFLDVEYDNNIAPILDIKQKSDEFPIICQQKLISNDEYLDPWVTIVVNVENENGNTISEIIKYDIYNNQEKVWWSEF